MTLSIPFPGNGKIVVKEGDDVKIGLPYFELSENDTLKIEVSKMLQVQPGKIFHHIRKLVGEEVKKNDILAEKKGFFSTKKILSPNDGVIREINHNEGVIELSVSSKTNRLLSSFFQGKIKKIDKNELKIEVKSKDEYKVIDPPRFFGGPVRYFKSADAGMKSEDIEGTMIFALKIDEVFQAKAEALGASGFITLPNKNLPIKTNTVYLKNEEDIEKILKAKYSLCLVDEKNEKIIFYE